MNRRSIFFWDYMKSFKVPLSPPIGVDYSDYPYVWMIWVDQMVRYELFLPRFFLWFLTGQVSPNSKKSEQFLNLGQVSKIHNVWMI